jgi:hypothetical protein
MRINLFTYSDIVKFINELFAIHKNIQFEILFLAAKVT